MGFIGFFFLFMLFAFALLLLSHSMNRQRIKKHIESKGGKIISISWAPFGKGWVGDESNMIYKVEFRNNKGEIKKTYAKTGFFSGVYFAEDDSEKML
jgi:hypothetical protein